MDKMEIRQIAGDTIYSRGRQIYKNDNIPSFSIKEDGDYHTINAIAQGSGYNQYAVELVVNNRDNYLESANCECAAFENYPGICKHCTAVLLEHEDYINRRTAIYEYVQKNEDKMARLQKLKGAYHKPQKAQTSAPVKQLLTRRQTSRLLPFTQDQEYGRIRLEPHLVVITMGIMLEFKIGIPGVHMYILKDIIAFGSRIENKSSYEYGKKLKFIHSMEMFEADSQPIVNFLFDWIQENKADYSTFSSYNYSGRDYQRLKEIRLSGSELESFLDSFGDRPLSVTVTGSIVQEWKIRREPIKRRVKITGKEEGIEIKLDGCVSIIGKKDNICFAEGIIYRSPRNQMEPITEFLVTMENMKNNTAYVSNDDIPAFVWELLPELETYCDCRKYGFDVENYGIEPVVFEIYLDAPREVFVTFRVLAIYGDKKYSVYDKYAGIEKRDIEKEAQVAALVSAYCNAYDSEKKEMVLADDDDMLFELLTRGIPRMQQVGEVYISETLKNISVDYPPKVTVGISLSGNMLELSMTAGDMPKEQLVEILSKYDKKKKYFRLKNGDFVDMQEEGIKALVEMKQGLRLTDKQLKQERITLPKYRALYLDSELKEYRALPAEKDKAFRSLIRNMKTVEDNDFEIPPQFGKILREYQKRGFLWLKTLKHNGFGGILADDMGLGKTLQVIAFLESEHIGSDTPDKGRTLIISPASLVFNWNSEFQKFAPGLPVKMVVGKADERHKIISNAGENEILLTSYDLLKRDIKTYSMINFSNQIIDEAQSIKNHNTQTAKAVKEIEAGFRLALTGTPVENRLSELWSIFDYLMPGFLYTYQKFREEIEMPVIQKLDEAAMKRLQKMIRPFVLRRLKKEVLTDLPDKLEKNYFTELEGEQQKIYDAHVKRLKLMLDKQSDDEFRRGKIQILSELTRLRQICCDPSLIYDSYNGGSVKIQLCIELILSAISSGHKILLFSQFTSMLELIKTRLAEEKVTFYSLTGATPKAKRAELVEAFNHDDTQVFCISLKAGGTGLNLTAADIVIHYDPWWNQAAQTQATDRAHRIGQQNVVTVYKLIVKGTIEENIMKLQEQKKELADQLLGGEGMAAGSFSKEELLELLR